MIGIASWRRHVVAQSLALGLGLLPGTLAVRCEAAPSRPAETVAQATCRIVERAAHANRLPASLLTRLIWTESRFRAGATSPAGAQGIAQLMPRTVAERGVVDPYDPQQAIPVAARLLVSLKRHFGNIGLAAAAYNAGPGRVAGWLAGTERLPRETQAYVVSLTGRPAEDWARPGKSAEGEEQPQSCMATTAALRAEADAGPAPIAPWGIQLAGSFSKAAVLAAFERERRRYFSLFGTLVPMVIGTRVPSRGTRPFYRVMLPESSRTEADRLCSAIRRAGGACVALRT